MWLILESFRMDSPLQVVRALWGSPKWGVPFMRCLRVGILILMEGCRGMPVLCWGFHSPYFCVEGSQNLFGL